jgi:surfeit locus 1 family protein
MRIPIFPTLLVAIAVAVMIGLGVWQLQRASWKEALLADLASAAGQPSLDLDPLLLADDQLDAGLSFRRASVSCTRPVEAPQVRAGRNRQDESGYAFLIPCRSKPALLVNIGWGRDPTLIAPAASGRYTGMLGLIEPGAPVVLTADTAAAPLLPSASPNVADIPNNHRLYAAQWFFFALAAVIIYLLALRRRCA